MEDGKRRCPNGHGHQRGQYCSRCGAELTSTSADLQRPSTTTLAAGLGRRLPTRWPKTVARLRLPRWWPRVLAGLAGVVALVAVGVLVTGRINDAKRWSDYPHAMGCQVDQTGGGPTPPPEARVDQAGLTHLGGERLELTLTFRNAVPSPASVISPFTGQRINAPGSVSFIVALKGASGRGSVQIFSTGDGSGGWGATQMESMINKSVSDESVPRDFDSNRNLLDSVVFDGKIARFTLSLADVPDLLGRGPFRPDVNVLAQIQGRASPNIPDGDFTPLAAQVCGWSTPTSTRAPFPADSAPTPLAPPSTQSSVAGMIVFLDPQGSGGGSRGAKSALVPDGRGGSVPCEQSAGATQGGLSANHFAWDTVLRVRQKLNSLGVRTAMSRGNDDRMGACSDERGAMSNSVSPNAIVTVGTTMADTGSGFVVQYSDPPLNAAQATSALQLARMMRDQLTAAGLRPNADVGSDGLQGVADAAELNTSEFPAVRVLLGDTSDSVDASNMNLPEGRQRYADAVVKGIVAFLQTQPPRR